MKMKPLTTTLLSVVLLLGCQSEEKQVKTPLPVKVKLMTVTTKPRLEKVDTPVRWKKNKEPLSVFLLPEPFAPSISVWGSASLPGN